MSAEGQSVAIDSMVCPVPLGRPDRVLLGHGSGGKLTQDLVRTLFMAGFENPTLGAGNDAARIVPPPGCMLAVSTDSHVVRPLFFPGGDIGRLAVCGTVNDVAMLGAEPRFLTAGFILEEGLPYSTLERVVRSMQEAASEAGVEIAAGDTKVVEKGFGDGIYITTAGVGWISPGVDISGSNAGMGDVVVLSGSLGEHGIAVLSARGELGLGASVQSDIAPLNGLVRAMISVTDRIRVLRDPTRGGLATTLNEIAEQSGVGIELDESAIPVRTPVRAACEVLGFDPLYLANEGKLIAIVAEDSADDLLTAMRKHPYGADAAVIGRVTEGSPGRVLMRTVYGTHRVLDMLSGELLPRIC